MKCFAALLLSPLAALVAAAPTSETVTISKFIYRAPAGGFTVDGQHVDRYMQFKLSVDDVTCQALDVDIPATGYVCDDPAYTFDTLNPGVQDATFLIRLYHSLGDADDGYVVALQSPNLSYTNRSSADTTLQFQALR